MAKTKMAFARGNSHPLLHLLHCSSALSSIYEQWSTEGDFLAVAKAEGEGGKTSALEVKAEGETKGLVFVFKYTVGIFRHRL